MKEKAQISNEPTSYLSECNLRTRRNLANLLGAIEGVVDIEVMIVSQVILVT